MIAVLQVPRGGEIVKGFFKLKSPAACDAGLKAG
jgi:hypothetical protein